MTFFSRKHLRLLLLPALLLLTGCAGSAKETADSTENEKLSAVATIFPQYDFLRTAYAACRPASLSLHDTEISTPSAS